MRLGNVDINLLEADGETNWTVPAEVSAEIVDEPARPDRSGPNRYDMKVEVLVDQDAVISTLATSGSLQFGEGLSNFTHARFDFDGAEFESADTILASFSGFAAANIAAEKPGVEVAIEVSSLEVKAGDDTQEDPVETGDAETQRLFSTDKLSYSWLNSLDLDADIRIAEASVGDDMLSNISVVATIRTLQPCHRSTHC